MSATSVTETYRDEQKFFIPRTSTKGSTTTGYLRWCHIWQHCLQNGLTGKDKQITILGPGLRKIGESQHCPQLGEAMKLWDESTIHALDSNAELLATIGKIDMALVNKTIQAAFLVNFAAYKQNQDTLKPLNAMLSAKRETNNQVIPLSHRMGEDHLPQDFPLQDVFIATFSLFYPMKDLYDKPINHNQRLPLLTQYLSFLKPKGVFYVEKDCMMALLVNESDRDIRNFAIKEQHLLRLIQDVKAQTGLQIRIERLPPILVSSYVQGQPYLYQPTANKSVPECVQTTDVYAITRENDPLNG